MKKILLILSLLFITNNVYAAIPSCDFKGISVGDKIEIPDAMKKLGVKNYKMNPVRPNFQELEKKIEQHGLMGANEIVDNDIGAFCTDTVCKINQTIIGNNIPASVFILFNDKSKIIQAIEVTVNQSYWNDLITIVKNKYKGTWTKESSSIHIANYKTNKGSLLDREEYKLKTAAKNFKTNDSCEMSAIEHDIIFEHPSNHLGLYHSIFDIELISNNF